MKYYSLIVVLAVWGCAPAANVQLDVPLAEALVETGENLERRQSSTETQTSDLYRMSEKLGDAGKNEIEKRKELRQHFEAEQELLTQEQFDDDSRVKALETRLSTVETWKTEAVGQLSRLTSETEKLDERLTTQEKRKFPSIDTTALKAEMQAALQSSITAAHNRADAAHALASDAKTAAGTAKSTADGAVGTANAASGSVAKLTATVKTLRTDLNAETKNRKDDDSGLSGRIARLHDIAQKRFSLREIVKHSDGKWTQDVRDMECVNLDSGQPEFYQWVLEQRNASPKLYAKCRLGVCQGGCWTFAWRWIPAGLGEGRIDLPAASVGTRYKHSFKTPYFPEPRFEAEEEERVEGEALPLPPLPVGY